MVLSPRSLTVWPMEPPPSVQTTASDASSGLSTVTTAALRLAELADHVVQHDLTPDSNLGGNVATGCSLAAAAITNALADVPRASKRYEWDKVLFTHSSGAVGRDGVPHADPAEQRA